MFSFIFFAGVSKSVFWKIIDQKKTTMKKIGKMKKASPELAEFIGKKVASRGQAFKIVFAYVKERKLQVSHTVLESRP